MIDLIMALVSIYDQYIYIYKYRIFYNSMASVSLKYFSKPERERDRMNEVEGRREEKNKQLDSNGKQLFSTCSLTNKYFIMS